MSKESMVKMIPSTREPLGRVKVEAPVHHPIATELIKETESWSIYRIPLFSEKKPLWMEDVQIPNYLNSATHSKGRRDSLALSLNMNRRKIYNKKCNKYIGKPNSAFVALRGDNTFIVDYLFEKGGFESKEPPKVHDILRENINYAEEFQEIQENLITLSGHLAPFNISTKDAAYILKLDAFRGEDAYEKSSPKLKKVIRSLYGGRIIPLTSDGFIIKLDSKIKLAAEAIMRGQYTSRPLCQL